MFPCTIFPGTLIESYKRVQNWAVKVCGDGGYTNVSPLLKKKTKKLHWFPVVKGIQSKISVLCYRCLNNVVGTSLIDWLID